MAPAPHGVGLLFGLGRGVEGCGAPHDVVDHGGPHAPALRSRRARAARGQIRPRPPIRGRPRRLRHGDGGQAPGDGPDVRDEGGLAAPDRRLDRRAPARDRDPALTRSPQHLPRVRVVLR